MLLRMLLKIFPVYIVYSILICNNCKHFVSAGVNCDISPAIPEGFAYTKSEGASEKGALKVIGGLKYINNGIVPDKVKGKVWTNESTGMAGYGYATLDKWDAVGMAVFLNGMAIIRSTDKGSPDYNRTKIGPSLKTQYSVFITHDAKPDGEYTINYGLPIKHFYVQIYDALGRRPFCYFGLAQFGLLRGYAFVKAPIYGEPLFPPNQPESRGAYLSPIMELPDEFSLIVGCDGNHGDLRNNRPELFKAMEKAKLEFVSHAVTLNKCKNSVMDVEPEDVKEVFRIFSGRTLLKMAKVWVFTVKGPETFVGLNN